MCTAITYKSKDFYFGRTLDYDFSYGDEITITPRNYPLKFKHMGIIKNHYALIGMAHVVDDYPLYYDVCNEKGLAIAGLNFFGNAFYNKRKKDFDNVAVHELILWLLSQCKNVKEVKKLIKRINIIDTPFNENLKVSPLHYLISDGKETITLEPLKEGIKIYENKVGVLTNNPLFDIQMFNLNNYKHLSTNDKNNTFAKSLDLNNYSRGLGAIGLPGDISSMSRFVRASFMKMNSVSKEDELSSISQFFHILNTVDTPRGCCEVENNKYEITLYTSCININKGIYYYTTYNNRQINAIDMHKVDLKTDKLIKYPLLDKESINYQN